MEDQRGQFESCRTSTLFTIAVLKKLSSVPRHLQLVNKDTNETVAEPHSQRRSSIFRKPRDMSLEISQVISHAVDIVVLTFILVWRERLRAERAPNLGEPLSMIWPSINKSNASTDIFD